MAYPSGRRRAKDERNFQKDKPFPIRAAKVFDRATGANGGSRA
jgi:hypothetical protein